MDVEETERWGKWAFQSFCLKSCGLIVGILCELRNLPIPRLLQNFGQGVLSDTGLN
jgi:hypothetical protein